MSAIVREMLRDYHSLDDSSRFDLDRAIEALVARGDLDGIMLIVLKLTTDGVSQHEIAKAIDIPRRQIGRQLIKLCSALAEELGEEYKDTKLLREVENRIGRPLTKKEEAFCYKVLKAGHPIGGLSVLDLNGVEDERDRDKDEG